VELSGEQTHIVSSWQRATGDLFSENEGATHQQPLPSDWGSSVMQRFRTPLTLHPVECPLSFLTYSTTVLVGLAARA